MGRKMGRKGSPRGQPVGRDPLLGWYQASSVQLLLQAGGRGSQALSEVGQGEYISFPKPLQHVSTNAVASNNIHL